MSTHAAKGSCHLLTLGLSKRDTAEIHALVRATFQPATVSIYLIFVNNFRTFCILLLWTHFTTILTAELVRNMAKLELQ